MLLAIRFWFGIEFSYYSCLFVIWFRVVIYSLSWCWIVIVVFVLILVANVYGVGYLVGRYECLCWCVCYSGFEILLVYIDFCGLICLTVYLWFVILAWAGVGLDAEVVFGVVECFVFCWFWFVIIVFVFWFFFGFTDLNLVCGGWMVVYFGGFLLYLTVFVVFAAVVFSLLWWFGVFGTFVICGYFGIYLIYFGGLLLFRLFCACWLFWVFDGGCDYLLICSLRCLLEFARFLCFCFICLVWIWYLVFSLGCLGLV